MDKWLCWITIVVSGALAIVFLIDMVASVPFGGLSITIDIICFLCALTIAYLGWNAKRDLR